MFQLIITVILALVGWGFAALLQIGDLSQAMWYDISVKTLLAIGLFASVYGIDTHELKQNQIVVALAVTVGVLLKILFIGGILYFFTQNPLYFLIGAIVAQIDPLSVAALVNNTYLSKKAKTVLIAWASFDDPVTVIASIYIASLIGLSVMGINTSDANPYISYLFDFAKNIGFVLAIYIVHRFVGKKHVMIEFLLLAIVFIIGVWQFWMLGVALSALFLRPPVGKTMDYAVHIALYISIFLLGMLLVQGINITMGLFIALAAIASQVIVGLILTVKYSNIDRIHLAFAQQNGVTAIILSLVFYSAALTHDTHFNIVAMIAPAILFINIIYLFSNAVILRFERNKVDLS